MFSKMTNANKLAKPYARITIRELRTACGPKASVERNKNNAYVLRHVNGPTYTLGEDIISAALALLSYGGILSGDPAASEARCRLAASLDEATTPAAV